MPSQTVAGPGGGTITINYGSSTNSAQVAQFAGSVSSLISSVSVDDQQQLTGTGTDQLVTGIVGFIDPGTFTLSAATQAVVVENNTSNTITGGGNAALTILSGIGALNYTAPSGNTTVIGGGGGNVIDFQSGLSNAAYLGGGGNTVSSGSGNATISAGNGGNLILVGSGTANIVSTGTDTVIASSGSDTINVEGSNGQPGFSTDLVYGGTARLLFVNGSGTGTVYGQFGASDTMYAGAGGGVYTGGSGGNNALIGGSGAATLYGGGAGDTLYGGSGNSALVAGNGAETLVAGSGNDTMSAGSGPDLFSFYNGSTGGTDAINNFNASEDKITVQGYSADVLSTASISSGSETLSLSDGTTITFNGVTNLTSGNFV